MVDQILIRKVEDKSCDVISIIKENILKKKVKKKYNWSIKMKIEK